ncbi:MAG: ParB/RepB/Spo0J family partition protein [Bacteroidales bacterium]|nr:ParB/RepB/Spo0J family partition protein [Bacteroidales bacterium]
MSTTQFTKTAENLGTTETISDVKKGSKESKMSYIIGDRCVMKMDDLLMHPDSKSIYTGVNSAKIDALAENINEKSLINPIIINKNNQILSGNLRFLALQKLGIQEIEVYIIDINPEDELEFIISANQQRVKTAVDERNEIILLYAKYSPGQGNRDSKGEDTRKKVALITGYSLNKISTIRKIDATFPSLLDEVVKDKMTMNKASKLCDVIIKLEQIGKELGLNLVKDLSTDKIGQVFKNGMITYCEKNNPEYVEMIKNGKITPQKAYNDLLSAKEPKEPKKSKTSQFSTDFADDSNICPCCAQRIKKDNKELDFVKKWNENIREYIANLRYTNNAA